MHICQRGSASPAMTTTPAVMAISHMADGRGSFQREPFTGPPLLVIGTGRYWIAVLPMMILDRIGRDGGDKSAMSSYAQVIPGWHSCATCRLVVRVSRPWGCGPGAMRAAQPMILSPGWRSLL